MKRLLSIILAITIVLTFFAACGEAEQALTATELLDLGEKYLLDLDYEQAIVYFNQVIEVEPRNSRAYMGAAEAYVGLGDTESAIDLLKTALDVFSDDDSVSIELLEMLLEIDPTNVEWYLELAQIYINSGNRALAISILKQGMDVVGDDKTQLYAKLIEIDSDTTQWYFELAEVYEDQSNIPSAVDTLELGLNNFEENDIKIDFSEELIEIDETNAEWYLTIAYIYIAQGDTDAAIAILREGLEKASDTTEIEALLNQLVPDLSELKITSGYSYYDGYLDGVGEFSSTTIQEYEYDSDGNITSSTEKYYYVDDDANNENITEYTYGSSGRWTSGTVTSKYVWSDGSMQTTSGSVEYNSNGNVISSTTTENYTTPDGTLFTRTYSSATTYEYDSHGMITSQITKTVNNDGSTSTTTLTWEREYDSYGNVVSTIYKVDANGSTSTSTSTTTYEYEYDSEDNIMKVTSVSDSGSVSVYKYNSDGAITYISNDSATSSYSDEFEYDSFGLLVSRTETRDGVTTTYNTDREYEYGDDGKVQKCVITEYNVETGSVYSVTTMERVG